MLYYVELSENEDTVPLGQLFPLEYVVHPEKEWWDHEGWAFEGTDGELHPLTLWEDKTGYRVEL